MGGIGRREFIASGALAALGLAGCGATPSPTTHATTPQPTTPAPTEPSPTPPSAPDWRALAASLDGTLVLPGDAAYAQARLVYQLRFETAMPAAVAFCASATDVQRAVDFARAHAVQPIPRCGGHSYAGYSTGDGLIVDVTPMNQVSVAGQVATVGAGARLIDLYAATAQAGMLVPGGSCPSVGISGLALGGGIGVVGRRYGLTCDQIQSLTAVTADGRIVTASPESEPDLYWASRGGGGGNFAIVTQFELAAHPIPPLTLFDLPFPWAAAGDVLGAWQQWVAATPPELWTNCLLLYGAGAPSVRVGGVYCGEPVALQPLLDRLIAAVGTQPTSQFAAANDYLTAMLVEAGCSDLSVAQCHLPSQNPAGELQRTSLIAKSQYVASPYPAAAQDAAVRALEAAQSEIPALGAGLAFDSYGGAINAVAPDATAFVHRGALCQIQISASGASAPSDVAAAQSWLAGTAAALAPYSDGQAYQNYIDPTLADWQQAYYGSNLPRLVEVKRAYDPDDLFHFAQSIPTAI